MEVAETVLMQKCVDENKLKIHVTSKQFIAVTERNLIHDHSIATFVENVNHHRSKTLRLRLEETAGYTILRIQAGFFATVVSKELAKNFSYQNQYVVARNSNPGNNPSTDTAVLILNGNYKPKIVYEYKPVVHHTMDGVDVLALTEALLQANYVLKYHKVTSVLQCLTDLEKWHYFKFCTSRTTSLVMSIDWYHKVVQDSVLSISDIENHLFMQWKKNDAITFLSLLTLGA